MRRLVTRLLSIAATSSLVFAATVVALAEEKKNDLATDLNHYFAIRTALAADKVDGLKEHADALAKSADEELAKHATDLAKAKEIKAARAHFGDLSKRIIPLVDEAAKKGEKLPTIYKFHCSMSHPVGDWLQETKEIGNPYWGSEMLKCGELVKTYAAK